MAHWIQTFRAGSDCEAAVLVTIEQIRGSTPREIGTAMLVTSDHFYGTIGGGNLEYQALKLARQQLAENTPDKTHRFPLAASLGQCCGGWVSLSFNTVAPDQAWCEAYLQQQEAQTNRLPVLLFGAGHVGSALVAVLQNLPFDVTWVDERESLFPDSTLPDVKVICHDDPVAEVMDAPANSRCLIMTHSHTLDFELVDAALKRGFPYIGLIGSQTKRKSFRKRLKQRGMSESMLGNLICPIGIEGIQDKAPAVIAVSVAAQLLTLAP
ncbi:xanthine dehydrogenase accessory protein XdhC [Leucothrix pacifica]|uniref:Xanthine dehydrogenase accessory protein XdhC n=1 Tax=Leucothrix pacifica TaxID=1247513 RepID=A0A317CKK0_9GAMM|nr:xanthine dehydrogenase accessory protein XdhC [Leucothrix pacifica]PWQ96862.1 xanthine dehydrogenase accessory protein XdhC [Leucothrix pacifica]